MTKIEFKADQRQDGSFLIHSDAFPGFKYVCGPLEDIEDLRPVMFEDFRIFYWHFLRAQNHDIRDIEMMCGNLSEDQIEVKFIYLVEQW